MKRMIFATAALMFMVAAGPAYAVNCTTEAPLDGTDVVNAFAPGGIVLDGTADCPSDPTKADKADVEAKNQQQNNRISNNEDDIADNAEAIEDNADDIADVDAESRERDARLEDLTKEGLATMGALHVPHVEKNFAASLSGGFYGDHAGLGFGAGVRFDETWQIGGSLAIGTEGGDVAGKAALTGQW